MAILNKTASAEAKLKQLYPNLSGLQRKVAEAVVNPEDTRNVSELCADFGISRTTYYNWQANGDFSAYVEYLIEHYTSSIMPKVWKQVGKKVDEGSMEAIKLVLEYKGKFKNETSINNNVVIFTGEEDIPE